MSLFDRFFRRRRGGADTRPYIDTGATTPTYTTQPAHGSGAHARGDDDRGHDGKDENGNGKGDDRDPGHGDSGDRGQIDPSSQQIQLGGEGSSQQVEVGDSEQGDSGGEDPGGDSGGGDSGGGDSGGGDSGGGDSGGGGGE